MSSLTRELLFELCQVPVQRLKLSVQGLYLAVTVKSQAVDELDGMGGVGIDGLQRLLAFQR